MIPAAVLMMFFPQLAMAAGSSGQDLMASGNTTVKATFGKDSSVVKWVVLAEVLVGAVMYMMTKTSSSRRFCHHLCIYCCGYGRRWPLTGNKTMSGDENKLKKYRFPETLTNQSRWFGLPLDELIPAAICIGWGITTSKYLFGIGAAVLVYFGIKTEKGRGSSRLRDLIYWYMPTALLRGIFHNVPDSCFRQWIK